ncbi:MAG: YitT family protein [Chitinophagaceae bacterium]|nr:YitT family protein [Chitinophagaceae bacterium]MCW5905345.1 YitT family protein [Chitinophagaceae bacterium]
MKNKFPTKTYIADIIYSLLGIFFATFALKSLLVPNGFLDGGVTGMSLLLHEVYHFPLSIVIILANIPFIIMSGIQINKKYATKTFISIVLLGFSLQFLPLPDITENWQSNMVTVAIFGGFFLGLGIGLGMRAGCAIDGIEILALYTRKRIGLTMSELIMGINVLIFLLAALGLGLEKAFYAMLTYYVATRTIDYVVEGIEEYTSVTIISSQSEAIKEKLAKELGRGITVYKGERGFMKDSFDISHDCDIVFTVATRLEVRKLKSIIQRIDPQAFVFTGTIKEAAGGVLKHTSGHH